MYVYVQFDSVVKVINNVTINEDCGPVVEGKLISDSPRRGRGNVESPGSTSGSRSSSVDAIAWFKALAMEAVYLDCNARDARWSPRSVMIQESTSDPNEHLLTPKVSVRLRRKPKKKVYIDQAALRTEESERPFMPESARPLFSDHPGVVDFNPIIDEMFERTEVLVRSWDRLSEEGQLHTEIAQILHCYVFPAVTFQKEDIPALRESLRLVTVKQETVERDIKEAERNIDITEKYLNRQKEVILQAEEMTTQSYLQACDPKFIESFYTHVTKDIQKKNARLDNVQLKMNELKKTGADPEKLARLKRERDGTHEIVQKLIVVREAIRNHLYRPFIPKKKKKKGQRVKLSERDLSLHAVFQQVHLQLVEHKDHLRKLCYRKLYTSSVREAIESTVRVVSQESPQGQGDCSEFSVYLGSSEANTKQWQSMRAKVDEWMSADDNNALFRAHVEGCQLVKDLANGILGDSQVASMGLEEEEPLAEGAEAGGGSFEMSVMSSGETDSGASELASFVVDRHEEQRDPSCWRAPMVKVMCEQVRVHTWELAENVVNFMDFQVCPGSRHINRAWVCYSPHFWRAAGEAVLQVYTHFHAPQARKVHGVIRSVALSDIMDSEFCRDFLTQRLSRMSSGGEGEGDGEGEKEECVVRGGFRQRHQPPDAVSAVSLDLMRCSVSDLYARVNRDGARLNYEMLELEELSGSLQRCSVRSEGSADSGDLSVGSFDNITFSAPNLEAAVAESEVVVAAKVKDKDEVNPDPSTTNTTNATTPTTITRSDSSTSDSGASIHSEDLYDDDDDNNNDNAQNSTRPRTDSARSSQQTVANVLSLFDQIVGPYHRLVQAVLDAPDVMEKLRAVWRSVDFLCQKGGEVCRARGMDTLLPLSIFATTSFPEELFVGYFVQLLILTDLKPSFVFHSMYDFSLTSAMSSYVYLFQARFPAPGAASDESDSADG
ncbi:uncharacterized protein LOC143289740 [Babylonia areolata]|uniref:uncharacterized protein LOC143289740 n=1 Tax=Babylonia areolata TaxID=304850 RepID=UPI003FD583A7